MRCLLSFRRALGCPKFRTPSATDAKEDTTTKTKQRYITEESYGILYFSRIYSRVFRNLSRLFCFSCSFFSSSSHSSSEIYVICEAVVDGSSVADTGWKSSWISTNLNVKIHILNSSIHARAVGCSDLMTT